MRETSENVYEAPQLVAAGDFAERTRGGFGIAPDGIQGLMFPSE